MKLSVLTDFLLSLSCGRKSSEKELINLLFHFHSMTEDMIRPSDGPTDFLSYSWLHHRQLDRALDELEYAKTGDRPVVSYVTAPTYLPPSIWNRLSTSLPLVPSKAQ